MKLQTLLEGVSKLPEVTLKMHDQSIVAFYHGYPLPRISNQFSLICKVSRCQYHWCSIYRGLERVGSWVPGGSVGRDQLAMAAKVRRHWFNPCRLGSRGHLGANFSLLLYTDLIKKRKPSRYFTDEGELIRDYFRD